MNRLTFKARAETPVKIPIGPHGLFLKGRLRGSWDKPLVIMVHGLGSNGRHPIMFLGARYLHEMGLSVLRLSLYGLDPQTRNLKDCTLQIHAADIASSVEFAKGQGSPKTFIVGHSYGGLAALLCNARLDGLVLWDPSHPAATVQNLGRFTFADLPEQGIRVMLDGYGQIDPLAMIAERERLATGPLAWSRKPYPVLFVSAQNSLARRFIQPYLTAAGEHQHIVIKDAYHGFLDSDDTMFNLFDQTGAWLRAKLSLPLD